MFGSTNPSGGGGGDGIDRILEVNDPTNLDNIGILSPDAYAAVKAQSDDGLGPLVLQMGDDSAADGGAGYAASLMYATESGHLLAQAAADKVHNHWGVYTRNDADFSGTDLGSSLTKRFNVDGGSPVTKMDAYGVNQFRMGPRGEGDGTDDMLVRAEAPTGQSAFYRLDSGGNNQGYFGYDASKGMIRMISYTGTEVVDVRLDDGKVILNSGGPDGDGEIQFGFSGARMYKENGEIKVENDSGTVTQLT